jgi:hypothetical protein
MLNLFNADFSIWKLPYCSQSPSYSFYICIIGINICSVLSDELPSSGCSVHRTTEVQAVCFPK